MKYALLQVQFQPSPPSSKEKSSHTKDSTQHVLNTIFPPRYVLCTHHHKLTRSSISNDAVLGSGQTEMTYGCNKCPVQLLQEKMLLGWESCWTQSYSKDGQERQESAPCAGSFIPSVLVRRWQRINACVIRNANQSNTEEIRSLHYSFFLYLDELIRQETINCPERGLLLFLIRDEIQMNIAAHKTLYESGIAFGLRETLRAEQGKADTKKIVKDPNYLKTHIIETFNIPFKSYSAIYPAESTVCPEELGLAKDS